MIGGSEAALAEMIALIIFERAPGDEIDITRELSLATASLKRAAGLP